MTATRQKILTIAGSDSLAGGGLQADLATFAKAGFVGYAAITAIVSIGESVQVAATSTSVLQAQLASLAAIKGDFAAIKVGLLCNCSQLRAVAAFLTDYQGPIVVDPVLAFKEGTLAVPAELLQAYRTILLPLATVITPNWQEGLALADWSLETSKTAGQELAQALLGMGTQAVFLKAGFVAEAGQCLDYFAKADEQQVLWHELLSHRGPVNGAGCTLSANYTVGLAQGQRWLSAGQQAVAATTAAIQNNWL
ncbi:hydroxymethylpyrimidine/phosphomethylpyrimidine kinase [Leuconostocaceae bacterium ESL0958]|nr:hydroxymethylpyrimidine/phosphomethylpyrimidine kinase [Leuconostocaceae bacterium ESL0958]